MEEERFEEFVNEYRRVRTLGRRPTYDELAGNLEMSKSTVSNYMIRLRDEHPELTQSGEADPELPKAVIKALNKLVDDRVEKEKQAFEENKKRNQMNEKALVAESETRKKALDQALMTIDMFKKRVMELEAERDAAQNGQRRTEQLLQEKTQELGRCQGRLQSLPALEEKASKVDQWEKECIRLQATLNNEVSRVAYRDGLLQKATTDMEKLQTENQNLRIENARLNDRLKEPLERPHGIPASVPGKDAASDSSTVQLKS